MDIGNSWMNPVGDTIADWDNNSIDGGHAVLFSGYRHVGGQRQFLVHNSWSDHWGNNGYAYISEAMVNSFIKTAYKVSVTDPSAPPAPPPPGRSTRQPQRADRRRLPRPPLGGLGHGTLRRRVPDDSRPANGQCGGGTGGTHKPAPKH